MHTMTADRILFPNPRLKMRWHPRRLIQALLSCLLTVFAPSIATAESIPPQCGEKVQQILHGNLSIGSINNVTIRNPLYIYYGPVSGLDDNVLREDYLALTYEGKGSPSPHSGNVPLQCSDQPEVALQSVATAPSRPTPRKQPLASQQHGSFRWPSC